MSIQIATGSWTDDAYVGVLYPKGLPKADRLKCYATRFGHLELNGSYHAVPVRANTAKWAEATPPGFFFDVKLFKEFSFDPGTAVRAGWAKRVLDGVQPLMEAKKLGVFFLLMTPDFEPARRKLEEIDAVVEAFRPQALAVELRHSAWVAPERREQTLEYFRTRGLTWIEVDMPQIAGSTIMPPLDAVTNPRLAYLRLHGRRPDWFQLGEKTDQHAYEYSAAELDEVAARVRRLAARAADVRVVANNHAQDFAPKTALALKKLFGQPAEAAPGEQGELF